MHLDTHDRPAKAPMSFGRRARSPVWGVVLIVLAVCIALVVIITMAPSSPLGDASAVFATFVGYTNNPAGMRVAMFRINNRSRLPIRREWYYEIHLLNGSTWTPQPTVRLPAPGPVILPNESEEWSIKAPVTNSRWRVVYPYEEHKSWVERIREKVRLILTSIGLRIQSRSRTYAGFSEEVEPLSGNPP